MRDQPDRILHLASLLAALTMLCAASPLQAQHPTSVTSILNGESTPDTTLEVNHNGSLLMPGTFNPKSPNDSIPATGAGTRLMWYPAKAAFRAGRIGDSKDGTQWDAAKVGDYSVAFGVDTKASGSEAVAMGDGTVASSQQAFAMGRGAEASADYALAIGRNTVAQGIGGAAFGKGTEANGPQALAAGDITVASADDAVALGDNTEANAEEATALGDRTLASGKQSTAMGLRTAAKGNATTAIGYEAIAATNYSTTIGTYNDKNRGNDDSDPSTGPLFVVGNGEYLSRSDALVLDQSGNLTISGSLTESSDRRLKTAIEPLAREVLEGLSDLRPVRFEFEDQQAHPSGKQIGLIAQDVQREFPALVSGRDGDYLSLSYSKLTAVLLKGIQEQQATIDSLTRRVRSLERQKREIDQLKKRLARLEEPAARSPEEGGSALAGLGGSKTGLLLTFLLGGLLGAALLARHRS